MDKITVIGAGLAGCEAAHTLSRLGFSVSLCEMKPVKFTPAQKSENFGELVTPGMDVISYDFSKILGKKFH